MKIFKFYVIVCITFSIFSLDCKKESNPIFPENHSPILYGQVIDLHGNPVEGVGIHYIFDIPATSEYTLGKPCPSTTISFAIPKRTKVSLKIFRWYTRDTIATLIDDTLNAGNFSVTFDASKVTNGFYIYQLIADTIFQEKIITFLNVDVDALTNTNPLTETSSSGTFELPYGLLGFGVPLIRTSGNGQALDTVKISSTIKIVLFKTGYSPLVQTVTIDTAWGMRKTFMLHKL